MMICVYVVAGDEERESTQFTTGAAGHAESGGSIPGGEDHQQQNLGADELPDTEESNQGSSLQMSCPLCSEKFPSQDRLESHAMSVHSVNSEGLQRLQSLINGSHWLNKKSEGIKLNHFVPNHLIGYRYYFNVCLLYYKITLVCIELDFVPKYWKIIRNLITYDVLFVQMINFQRTVVQKIIISKRVLFKEYLLYNR